MRTRVGRISLPGDRWLASRWTVRRFLDLGRMKSMICRTA